ncbi:amidohydrolase family protein [Azorhizobium doebereinerae]|uniref:amidohydrolase family protein n=1 Tax=Azorhizobium doebereinerae TaxID=281091 RepID=UPI0003FC83B4|nr:amidohydrolase family protein [Azorhizobium doebereinerae]
MAFDLDRRSMLAAAGLSLLAGGAQAQAPQGSQTQQGAAPAPAQEKGRPVLIRGSTVVTMDPALDVLATGDVLVRDGRIAAMGAKLEAPDAEVIDAKGAILAPGFINSHIHLAQAILRGLAGDATLDQYFKVVVARYTRHIRPEDLAASDYAAALEQLNGGTTTVFDWCREALTPAHADAIVDAMQRSGIRAFFGYGVTGPAQGGAAIRADVERLRKGPLASDDARVRLALALRGPDSSPMDEAEDDFRFARSLGLLNQFHVGVLLYADRRRRGVADLIAKGVIGPSAILVHANDLDPDEYALVAGAGAAIVTTPEVEMMMGHGQPATGRARGAGLKPGLGVDVVTGVGGDMFSQMRTMVSAQRLADNLAAAQARTPLPAVTLTARQALEAATIDGARLLSVEREIGSIVPGKRADLILVRADRLGTAPLNDPIGTLVFQANPGDVDAVMVDGAWIKRNGLLVGRDPARAVANLETQARALYARAAQPKTPG